MVMGSYLVKMLMAMLVWFLHAQVSIVGLKWPSHVKCLENERQALLNFKQALNDPFGMLSTWTYIHNNSDCCHWRGIQCNNQTGHLQRLLLRGSHPQYLRGAINLTSLIHLQNMEYLDLSYNAFGDTQIPEQVGSFKSLRYLNLSWSGFGGTIPSRLGMLTSLQYLDLSYNNIHGEIPSQLGNLSQLRYLDLSGNDDIHGEIPSQLGNLSQLRYLDLHQNLLSGAIPSKLGNLSQLRYLDLQDTSLSGAIPFQVGNLPILQTLRLDIIKMNDAKWLSSLSSLTTLDLSYNNLSYSHNLLQSISELIPNLRELRLVGCSLSDDNISTLFPSHSNFSTFLSILDLSGNMLTSSAIFDWIFNFTTNLRSLYLYGNLLEGSIPDRFGNAINSLQVLDLSYNNLQGEIPDIFGNATNSLQVLSLDSNKLQGEIPASLGNICTLQELYLDNNNLSGEISSFIQNSSWCNRHVFHTLYLSHNRITGMLPNLSIFTSLRELGLSNNQLTGEIPKSIGLLQELEDLYLQGNYLEGDINESYLTNLSKLVNLDLTDNSLSMKFGTTWVPPFQLINLGLASCKLGPSFPSWLQTQSHLRFLDISDAGIDDFVPDWFWNKLQSITKMNMSYNSLKGIIPNLPIKLSDDGGNTVILNSNQFEGGIPSFLAQAETLDLSKNKISDLNSLLCGKRATTNMGTLDLSNNQIIGQLPDCWEHLSSLKFVDLKNNKLSGKIPQSMGTLVDLEALVLRNNSLIGELPLTLKNCSSLVLLDVSENLLSGSIPSWVGESLQKLKILSLRVNNFFGSVSVHLCYLNQIQVLDLSTNNLSGEIPTCFWNFTAMMGMTAREIVTLKFSTKDAYGTIYDPNVLLTWKGQEYVFLNPENLLKSIDLSSNDLTGQVPKEVGYLLGLVSLNLSRNNLHGDIPPQIGNLNSLEFLDLSRNHLTGKIPSTLSKIDSLGVLDLSNNNLSGRIPWEGHLETFDASSFEGNIGLCGQQLNKTCPGDETIAKPQGHVVNGEDDNSIFYEALYMSLGLGFFAGFWGLLGPILLYQPWRNAYGRFLNRLTDYILVRVEVNIAKFDRCLEG